MNVIFSSPFAVIGFSAIPVLVAIYLLRNRFRNYDVSSLMLWQDQKKARQGGLNLSRIQTPLLFLLEFLSIIMLILAATGPLIRSNRDTRVFVIILDNSFSMLAGNGQTARDKAIEDIRELLDESGNFQARFILAGKTPQLISNPVRTTSQALDIIENWKCFAPVADLEQAVTIGSELAGDTARILVITDRGPERTIDKGRLEWWAFGKSLSNLAFVNISRTSFDDKDRCFLAVANLSEDSAGTRLIVESTDASKKIMEESLYLGPGQVYRAFFEPEIGPVPLRARLSRDNLNIDNEIVLLPESPKPLRLQVSIKEKPLRDAVNKAIEATKIAHLTSIEPQLLITDVSKPIPAGFDLWTVQIISEPNAASYLGPFIIDHSHPLTEGLSLDGVIWAANQTQTFTGLPVIAAGNVPLLTDRESLTGSHNITINFNPDLSTLLQSPNWPVLLWNLFQWRKSFLVGLARSNILLGSTVTLTTDPTEENLTLIDPENNIRDISTLARTVLIEPEMPGLYMLKTENRQYTLVVNAVSKSESDLTKAETGKWGRWQQASLYWWEYRPFDWILLLIALALLTMHRFLTAGQQKGAGV